MNLTREELLELYHARLRENARADRQPFMFTHASDRELSPAELSYLDLNCYKSEEKDELEQQAPYPP